jgi:toxin ParE1/3/4
MLVLKKTRHVEVDVAEAAEWYNAQRLGLGIEFIAEVQGADRLLLANPLRYAVRFDDIRRLNLRRFPYGIFFIIHDETIVVIGVLHFRRDSRALLAQRRRLL